MKKIAKLTLENQYFEVILLYTVKMERHHFLC